MVVEALPLEPPDGQRVQYSRSPVARLRSHDRRHRPFPSQTFAHPEGSVTSNVGQSYPYTSESEAERSKRVAGLVAAREGLDAKLAAETTPLDANDRWWIWKCPTAGCAGLLHAAGYARDLHAVYVVCDGTCAKTFLR
jgi:hypothetical protein